MRKRALTNWWLRAAYILSGVAMGVVDAIILRIPVEITVGVYVASALLKIKLDARRS